MLKKLLILTLFMAAPLFAQEQEQAPIEISHSSSNNLVYGSVGGHLEMRSGLSETQLEAYVGYDRRISPLDDLYIGGRLGLIQEQLLTFSNSTQTKFFVGFQGYKLFSLFDGLKLKLGMATDIVQGDDIDPLYLYVGSLLGARIQLSQNMHLDIPLEAGVFPAFSGTPLFLRTALQLGFSF